MCPSSNDSSQRAVKPFRVPSPFPVVGELHRDTEQPAGSGSVQTLLGDLLSAAGAQPAPHCTAYPERMNMTGLALFVCVLACGAMGSTVYRREQDGAGSLAATDSHGNSTAHTPTTQGNDTAKVTRYSSIKDYMPTIKSVFIFVCGFSTLLIVCLIVKIFRSGKRIRKTRKYDIITTPAERVEMAPLNEDNFEDEDSTVFDVKYRYR